MPAIKGDMYITHCNYSQPASIKLDNKNIGGHLTPLHCLLPRRTGWTRSDFGMQTFQAPHLLLASEQSSASNNIWTVQTNYGRWSWSHVSKHWNCITNILDHDADKLHRRMFILLSWRSSKTISGAACYIRYTSLSVMSIESDLLEDTDFHDIVRSFAENKSRKKYF